MRANFARQSFDHNDPERVIQAESERARQRDQREWLDQQMQEKKMPPALFGRRDGRLTDVEYEDFERKRIQRFKVNLIRRIVENWSTISEFDRQEANGMALEDPEFADALKAAYAERSARELERQQAIKDGQLRQLEDRYRLMQSEEEERRARRNRSGDIDSYASVLGGARRDRVQRSEEPVAAAVAPAPAVVTTVAVDRTVARDPVPLVVERSPPPPPPQLLVAPDPGWQREAAYARQIQELNQRLVDMERYTRAPAAPAPAPTPAPPQVVQVQPDTGMRAVLDELQQQRALLANQKTQDQLSDFLTSMKAKVETLVEESRKKLDAEQDATRRSELQRRVNSLRDMRASIRELPARADYGGYSGYDDYDGAHLLYPMHAADYTYSELRRRNAIRRMRIRMVNAWYELDADGDPERLLPPPWFRRAPRALSSAAAVAQRPSSFSPLAPISSVRRGLTRSQPPPPPPPPPPIDRTGGKVATSPSSAMDSLFASGQVLSDVIGM